MQIDFESLLPFLTALKRKTSSVEDDDTDQALDPQDASPAAANGSPAGDQVIDATPWINAPSRIPQAGPDVQPPNLRFNDPQQQRATLAGLMQGVGSQTPPSLNPGQLQSGDSSNPAGAQQGQAAAGTSQSAEQKPGSRNVIVTIWNRTGMKAVGHAAAFDEDGNQILSQFPQCWLTERCLIGPNRTLPWSDTVTKEGRAPDYIFRVNVPDGAAFDKVAADHRGRQLWDWYPTWADPNETNCVYAVGKALQAGGVPVKSYDWPGNLGDDLLGKTNAKGEKWKVQKLPNVPWQPPQKK
jgi:hypothetical protein